MRATPWSACLVAVLALLAGNAAEAKKPSKKTLEYQETLGQWIGRSVDELLVTYGVPQNSVDMPSGGKLLTYVGTENIEASNMGSKLFGDKGAILDSDTDSQYKCIVNFLVGTDGAIKMGKIQHNDGLWIIDPCKHLIKGP